VLSLLSAAHAIVSTACYQPESLIPNLIMQAHGWLMAVGWGLLIPLGILTARHGKEFKPPLWFHLHRCDVIVAWQRLGSCGQSPAHLEA
jgi:hypothetical protein